jgi:DHA2 family multidrug resistance protein
VPGVIAAAIVLTMVRNPTPPRKMALDVPGLALLALAFGSMQYVLDEGERNDWFDDSQIVFFTCTFVAGLVAFVAWELYGTRTPIVDVRIFRYGNVRAGALCALLLGIVIFGPIVMLPQYVQGVLGFTATLSGLLILTRALPVLLLTPFVARLASAIDFRLLLFAGFALSAVAFGTIASQMTTQSDFGSFAIFLAFSGVAQSMLLVPLLVGILPSVPPADAPKASSIISLSVQLGGSIASTALVTAYDRRTFFHSDILRGSLTLAQPQVQLAKAAHGSIVELARLMQLQAVNAGFADAIFMLVPLAACGALAVFALRRIKSANAIPIEMSE